MKPARTLFPLLSVAVVVGVAAGQFVTSTIAAPPAPILESREHRASNAPALAARQQQDTETVHQTITRTVVQNGRTTTGSKSRTSSSKNNDDDNDDNDTSTTKPRPNPSSPSSSSTPETTTTPPQTTTTTTTTTDSSTTSPDPPKPKSGRGITPGAAAGIAAGAVAGVAIIAAIAFLVWRRRQGGIRGAVVTGAYPRGMPGMGEVEDGADPKMGLPPMGIPMPMSNSNSGGADGGEDGMEKGGDLGDGRRTRGEPAGMVFKIPPAGTMPGEAGFEYPGREDGYEQPPRQQHWLGGGDLGEARPVSAFTAIPSPGQPILPVSPMTPYRPDSSILAAYQQRTPQPQSRVSSYYPDAGSPDLPTYMIPGGDRTRAMSFSSVSNVGGGPRVAEFVGSPPPPVPSMLVVVEGQPPSRRSRLGWG